MKTAPCPGDFLKETPPRIIGTECEYDIQSRVAIDATVPSETVRKILARMGNQALGVFLTNGSKYHTDVGHQEVATAECLGPAEGAAADKAGSDMIGSIVRGVSKGEAKVYRRSGTFFSIRKEGERPESFVTKGYHENYLVPNALSSNQYLEGVLASHLVSRVWAGQGAVTSDGYVFSQKVSGLGFDRPISRGISNRTSEGLKPMAMIQDDGDLLTGKQRVDWARLEVRFADPNLSTLGSLATLASTSLVLRLVEHSDIYANRLKSLRYLAPYETAQNFSSDLSMEATGLTLDRKRYSALDMQEAMIEMAEDLSERFLLPDDEVQDLEIWRTIVDELRSSSPSEAQYGEWLPYVLDCAAKHQLLQQFNNGNPLSSNDPEIQQLDMAWDMVEPKGVGMRWWQKHPNGYVPKEMVDELIVGPPVNTRAILRSSLINSRREDISSVNWNGATMKRGNDVIFRDLYVTSS